MRKKALITGVTGQDGSYLAELLLSKGYDVFGLVRRLSTPNMSNIRHLLDEITLIEGDLTDQGSLNIAVASIEPDEIYNLAAQTFVGTSWKQPELTADVTGLGAVRVFEAAKQLPSDVRIYQASSSEMYGKVQETPQNEDTRFYPRSPYGCAKLYAHWMAINYRESYDMHISTGILFNHESPRRGIEFVTRKISDGVARIYHGIDDEIRLGNLDARRDWGYAWDYVDAMWRMLQQPAPNTYVISTGVQHSIRDLLEIAFDMVDLDYTEYVTVDPRFFRPAEVETLQGDYSKAREILDWKPTMSFKELIQTMVSHDISRIGREINEKNTPH